MHIFDALYKDRVVYSARFVDDALLAAIRSDPGVEAVDYDFRAGVDVGKRGSGRAADLWT